MAMGDDSWFEIQYNARAAVPTHGEIFARQVEASRRVRLKRPCYLDIEYGKDPTERLDIFPSTGSSRGVVSFIHGGYWRSRDKSDLSYVAEALCDAGFTCALPNYALCPQTSVEHIRPSMASQKFS